MLCRVCGETVGAVQGVWEDYRCRARGVGGTIGAVQGVWGGCAGGVGGL